MPLGVGGATTFSMASNHQTAGNHNFRDTASFDVAKQTRVKCTYCGCWATKGKDCGQCKRPTGPVKVPRNNNVKVEPLVKAAPAPTTGGTTPRTSMTAASTTTTKPDNAHAHKFRDEVAYDPSKQVKVKCQFCGCWAKKGLPCSLCKRVNTK